MSSNNFGDNISRIINDAVDSMDFTGFSRDINSAVKDAVFGTPSLDDIKLSDEGRADGYQDSPYDRQGSADPFTNLAGRGLRETGTANVPVPKRAKGTVSGPLMIAAGVCGAVGFGAAAIGSLALGVLFFGVAFIPGVVFASAAAASICVSIRGASIKKRAARFKTYLQAMKSNEFCSIKELADKCGRPVFAVKKDLKKMIKLGMFREGHIDDSEQWFIANDKTYDQYLQARDDFKNRKTDEQETARREANENDDERKLRQVLEQGDRSIDELERARTEITGEAMRTKLDEIESLVRKIFGRVKEKPSLLPDIRKFMDYYLPTTLKLVNVYSDFEKKSVQSDDVIAAKHEIEQTLGTIETAFGKLLEELYQDTVMDVSTDISVLKSMFARDGLTGGDFDKPGQAHEDGGKHDG